MTVCMFSEEFQTFSGKVNMLRNCPEYYRETSLAESIRETEDFIRYVRNLQVSGNDAKVNLFSHSYMKRE